VGDDLVADLASAALEMRPQQEGPNEHRRLLGLLTRSTVQPVRKSQLIESIQSYTRALIGTDSMTSSTGTIWNSA
jgi:hypothetical protein